MIPLPLDRPSGQVDLLVVAGEHSGDEQGARLVRRLKAMRPELIIVALGGERLKASGAQLLYPLADHSVVGFVEVLRHYRFFKRLFGALLHWIETHQPRNICLIDYPGFNLRLAAQLKARGLSRKGGGNVGVFYYIAPQVWAWKAKRRFAMAKFLDALGVIFPFEVECFADTDLPTNFVGHPFVAKDYQPPVSYDAKGPVLLLPGSRDKAVARIFPMMLAAFNQLVQQRPKLRATVIYPSESIRTVLERTIHRYPDVEGKLSLASCDDTVSGRAVLSSSGTMSLTCALAGIPGAIVYRIHPLTFWWAKRLIRVPYIGIANLLLEQPLYPEFIQGQAKTETLLPELLRLLDDPARIDQARDGAQALQTLLKQGPHPSAGDWLADRL